MGEKHLLPDDECDPKEHLRETVTVKRRVHTETSTPLRVRVFLLPEGPGVVKETVVGERPPGVDGP